MAVIDYRGFCISESDNPTGHSRFDYGYWHDNYDGTPEDGRRGHGCSVDDCIEQIDEMIDGDGVEA